MKQTYETKFRFTDVTTLPKISNLLKFTESVDRRRRHVVITTSKSKTIEEFQQHWRIVFDTEDRFNEYFSTVEVANSKKLRGM